MFNLNDVYRLDKYISKQSGIWDTGWYLFVRRMRYDIDNKLHLTKSGMIEIIESIYK
jgi:hypothetical protein